MFDGFTILKTGQNKDKVLMKCEGTECFWIEDKVSNIKMGNDAGLEGILMAHNWNDDCFDERMDNSIPYHRMIISVTILGKPILLH